MFKMHRFEKSQGSDWCLAQQCFPVFGGLVLGMASLTNASE